MGLLVQLSDVHTYLQLASGFTTDDSLLTQIITNVSAAIESWCRRSFSSVNSCSDTFDGPAPSFALNNRPVVSVSALIDRSQSANNEILGAGPGATFSGNLRNAPLLPGTVQIVAGVLPGGAGQGVVATDDGNGNLTGAGVAGGSTINYSSGAYLLNLSAPVASGQNVAAAYVPNSAIISPQLYSIDAQRGLVFPLPQPPPNFPIPAGLFTFLDLKPQWGAGFRRWQINYTAGFSSVPPDVQLAALMTIAGRYNRRDALAQEQVGDYRYSTQTGPGSGFPPEVEQLLSPWREVVI